MGNVNSAHFEETLDDKWWTKTDSNCEPTNSTSCRTQYSISSKPDVPEISLGKLSEENENKLHEFKLQLARKREKRRDLITEKQKEMEDLKQEVTRLKKENDDLRQLKVMDRNQEMDSHQEEENERLREEIEKLKSDLEEKSKLVEDNETMRKKNRELQMDIAEMQTDLQLLNIKLINFEKEREEYNTHVVALKNVISVSKHLLQIRETELKELKQKLEEIEKSFAEKEMQLLSQDIRAEYERQLANIRNLRSLYEERQRAERREKQELISQLDDARKDLQAEQKKNGELEERISEQQIDISNKYDEIRSLESNLGLSQAESKQFQAELEVINQLFSEVLLGFNSSRVINLDKLQKHLEDHHGLLQDIVVNELSSEVSFALPKVLLDLLNQVNSREIEDNSECVSDNAQIDAVQDSATPSIRQQMNSVEEIVENLPKVWRVLIELLSHRIVPTNNLTNDGGENPCYKTVETPKGPSLVLSVSQTFIRLKDLILEKKSLEKETSNLKQLNCHLENRLQDQEKRLELVQTELSKTWLVVGKMQKQHQMLHTQERILRYELAQKRKLLTELKEELEYSREKWAEARAKNSKTELQWRQLRTEFSARKNTTLLNDDPNNSTESGYSDDRECFSSDDEPGYETDISECAQKISSELNSGEPLHEPSQENMSYPSTSKEDQNSRHVPEELMVDRDGLRRLEGQEVDHIVECSDALDTHTTTADIVQKSIEKATSECLPSTSKETSNISKEPSDYSCQNTSGEKQPKQNLEQILALRDERLRRLEGQAEQLVSKVTKTANRGVVIANRLDDLHEVYGQNSNAQVGRTVECCDLVDDHSTPIDNVGNHIENTSDRLPSTSGETSNTYVEGNELRENCNSLVDSSTEIPENGAPENIPSPE